MLITRAPSVHWRARARTTKSFRPAPSRRCFSRRDAPAAVEDFERDLADVPVLSEPITAEIARESAHLRASWAALRLGDALVLATRTMLDAAILTADRAWTR
jgi:predicted nucleic acid-binding protein